MKHTRRSFIRVAALGAVAAQSLAFRGALADTPPLQFDFHSSFWENLHHRLYFQAQAYKAVRDGEKLEPKSGVWSALAASAYEEYRGLSATQRIVWERAMNTYIERGYADADLLGDFMPLIDTALAAVDDAAQPRTDAVLHSQLVGALISAAPVYRETLWNSDDSANRAWIAMVAPLVDKHSPTLTPRLAKWYQTPWPVGPYRVDVTTFANWAGFYTNTDPIHTFASPRDLRNNTTLAPVRNTGTIALEMIFHEASHTVITPGYGTIGTAIENAASELAKPEPEGLWHAVIFYTAGRAIADEYPDRSYMMIADAVNVYTHGWEPYHDALAKYWQPYLDGEGSLTASLKAVVAAVVA